MAYGTVNADVIQTSTSGGILGAGNASIMKNRIINGAMVISQRNGTSVLTNTAGKVYPVDRFPLYCNVASKCTTQQSTDAPAGFTNSILVTSTSAYTVGSGDEFAITQDIEGYNLADWNWGTANAKTATLSFWVKSSLTGTFGGSIGSGLTSYSYPYTYTISSANTWEYKTVAIAGPTTGSSDFSTTNGSACVVRFGLGCGSTFSGTAGSWSANNYFSATGATSVVGTSGATLYITGVQLEVGSSATGFEYRMYSTELQLCQRYFETSFDIGTAPANAVNDTFEGIASFGTSGTQSFSFKVNKRALPTMTYYSSTSVGSPTAGQWQFLNSSGAWANGVATQNERVTTTQFSAYVNSSTNLGIGQASSVRGNWAASSEL